MFPYCAPSDLSDVAAASAMRGNGADTSRPTVVTHQLVADTAAALEAG
eukprot:gene10506-57129_t